MKYCPYDYIDSLKEQAFIKTGIKLKFEVIEDVDSIRTLGYVYGDHTVHLNPHLMPYNTYSETILHEIAHLLAHKMHELKPHLKYTPHGQIWKKAYILLGGKHEKAKATIYDEKLEILLYEIYPEKLSLCSCDCGKKTISKYKVKKMQKSIIFTYKCTRCKQKIRLGL
jgi:predicted SprT family Zn-dependent metalloprotease